MSVESGGEWAVVMLAMHWWMDVMGQGKGLAALLHFCHFEMKYDLYAGVERKGKNWIKYVQREKKGPR